MLKWLERKLFLGEVLRDYGVVYDNSIGVASVRTSVLLTRRRGRTRFIFRRSANAVFGFSIQYVEVDATRETIERLQEILSDAGQRVQHDVPDGGEHV